VPNDPDKYSKERLEALLVIGRRLKLQYDALGLTLPPPLPALLEQLEAHLTGLRAPGRFQLGKEANEQ
jgi:hypothetical protein